MWGGQRCILSRTCPFSSGQHGCVTLGEGSPGSPALCRRAESTALFVSWSCVAGRWQWEGPLSHQRACRLSELDPGPFSPCHLPASPSAPVAVFSCRHLLSVPVATTLFSEQGDLRAEQPYEVSWGAGLPRERPHLDGQCFRSWHGYRPGYHLLLVPTHELPL